ncbi:hypothetical protein JM93_03913 [Roseibium hamelinense]|uniref:Peptidoglycan binding-like domain-containing protein n=1 Tax=Roseibium hamelinense TaxID=150831 RepID=A0A562SJ03_9HYPH|nr:peptidoglycan-binding domain-containing protein [Roseibium hamelinense]MTI42501.1 peptidoglycan-binding protein [Roseibium hamelinense]TWI80700.1 hypothetical protein JM93_03913 [Roseibium hamelinense]
MRRVIFILLFLFIFRGSAHADYNQSRAWFNSQTEQERVVIQLLLIFTGDYVAIVDAAFGNRTYEALRSFQSRNNRRQNGVLSEWELQLLWDQGGSVMEKVGFEFRDDLTTGITLGILESLFASTEHTERGKPWIDRNGHVELETLRIPHQHTSYDQLFQRLSRETASRQIEYTFYRQENFIVSGTNRGRNFYLRMFRTQNDTRGFSLAWDEQVTSFNVSTQKSASSVLKMRRDRTLRVDQSMIATR